MIKKKNFFEVHLTLCSTNILPLVWVFFRNLLFFVLLCVKNLSIVVILLLFFADAGGISTGPWPRGASRAVPSRFFLFLATGLHFSACPEWVGGLYIRLCEITRNCLGFVFVLKTLLHLAGQGHYLGFNHFGLNHSLSVQTRRSKCLILS